MCVVQEGAIGLNFSNHAAHGETGEGDKYGEYDIEAQNMMIEINLVHEEISADAMFLVIEVAFGLVLIINRA